MSSSSSPRHFALIPAAGVGSRMGTAQPKQYLPLAGKPMLLHALETFAAIPAILHTFVVVSPDDGYIDAVWPQHVAGRASLLRAGGPTRQQSVLNGLHAMQETAAADDWVLVHDAARPGLTSALVQRLIGTLDGDPVGGLLALPIVDTLKRGDAGNRVDATVPRHALWAAQTPQMFRYGLLRHALQEARDVTDEASAVEALGLRPRLVEGSPRNLKVTLPHDVALAELYLKGIA